MTWVIEDIRETPGGLRVDFVNHSAFVGVASIRKSGVFTTWIERQPLPPREDVPPEGPSEETQ
jgi:hypothetical protein